MALLNPVYAFAVPFLFVVTVPLAVLAGITTTIAFAVLILRVLVVYIDIGLSLLPQSLAGFTTSRHPKAYASGGSTSYATISSRSPSPSLRRRRRRPSSTSAISAGSTTPVGEPSLGLIPSVGAERDFEGLGGWRVGEDEIWTTINSRSELPDRQHGRNHHRSVSGGPITPGEGGYLMMKARTRSPETKPARTSTSPNSSRARTPTGPRMGLAGKTIEGYFPLSAPSQKLAKKPST